MADIELSDNLDSICDGEAIQPESRVWRVEEGILHRDGAGQRGVEPDTDMDRGCEEVIEA